MSPSPTGCARCGTLLDPHFRFCPECGLPASGEAVLSTEIADLRRRVEAEAAAPPRRPWGRWLFAAATTGMLAVAGLLGLVVFDRDLLEKVFPPEKSGLPGSDVVPRRLRLEPEWITVPPGIFAYGDPADHRTANVPYAFRISKYEVTNELWLEYLRSEGRRLLDLSLWQEVFPRQEGWTSDAAGTAKLASEWRKYPVTNVSPNAIADFCDWMTKRLEEPGMQIRMPTQLEWEHAARGATNRAYTWGDGDVFVEIPRHFGDTRLRAGLKTRYAVDDAQLAAEDTSGCGVVAMGVNVSEWTLMPDLGARSADEPDAPEMESISDIPPGGGLRDAVQQRVLAVAWRGASFTCNENDARRLARVWWQKTTSEPTASYENIGVRLVKAKAAR